jgi:outer membrane receptor protein involved in Fe transport
MSPFKERLCALATCLALAATWSPAQAEEAQPTRSGSISATAPAPPLPPTAPVGAAAGGTTVGEVVVTAEKREENINNVGMSIQAATGQTLEKLGITDTEDLQKIIPGFLFTPTYYGTNVFTIRGVGFQDTSLAGNPTVSVYLDEAPLPFSALTNGATLDLERVEVLKGPQGTLFGENATGGAINYIANKPEDHFDAGVDASYGRFDNADIQGFINTPVTDNLDVRLAGRINESGAWQQGYALNQGQEIGGQDFLNGRISVLWKPSSKLRALLTLNAWRDKGYTQMGQLFGIAELSPLAALSPTIANYPLAPHNDQAAGWNQCVNVSPYDPIANQSAGTTYNTIPNPGPGAIPSGPPESMGPGSVVQAGGQPTDCTAPRKNNTYFNPSLRIDYDLNSDTTFTSLTSFQRFSRDAAIDGSGMEVQDYQSLQHGKITSFYQEFRVSGKFWGKGNWIIGTNYEYDHTWDQFLQTYNGSSASPTIFLNPNYLGTCLNITGATFCPVTAGKTNTTGTTLTYPSPSPGINYVIPPGGLLPILYGNSAIPLGPTRPTDVQTTDQAAVYANAEYPILNTLTGEAGIRFTQDNRTGGVCGDDGGDGDWSEVAYSLQYFYIPPSTSPAASPPGTCASTGPGPTYNSPPGGGLIYSKLNQNNVSWLLGLNYTGIQDTLLYVNVRQGWKGGSFPTVALASDVQAHAVTQEGLLSYEGGFKTQVLDHQLQMTGAFFYYDYKNKQILGAVADPVYGALPSLVNVPKSHVIGFEFTETYAPQWWRGLVVSGSVSFQDSRIDKSSKNQCNPPPAQNAAISGPAVLGALAPPGIINCVPGDFYGFDAFGEYADFTGEHFPSAPELQAHLDAEYDWKIHSTITAFVGASVQFTSSTTTFFVNNSPIPAYLNVGANGPYPEFGGYETCSGAYSATPVGPCPTNHPNNPLAVPQYALLDLRAGVTKDNWTFQLWGRNVTDKWYWTGAYHVNDVLIRYTGMPATFGATFIWHWM